MYTREEASQVKKNFWTSFGQYMKPVRGAEGQIINWLNYKTGIKHLYFRLDAEKRMASVSVEISHPDQAERKSLFEQLRALREMLEDHTREKWLWQDEVYDETGRTMSRIMISIENVNVFNAGDWPQIISFLKPRIIALDAFWSEAKDFINA